MTTEPLFKAQRAAWKEAQIGTEQYTAAGQKLATLLDERNELMREGASVIAKERDAYFQNGQALRSMEVSERGLTETIKSARQERRLYMFAVREGATAIGSITGSESQLAKTMTQSASSIMGVKFALDAMGVAAKAAWPVAIIVAAWAAIRTILGEEEEKTKEINDELEKQYKLKVDLGMISPQEQKAKAQQDITIAQAEVIRLQNLRDEILKTSSLSATAAMLEKKSLIDTNAELEKANTLLLEKESIYKKLFDAQNKNIQEQVTVRKDYGIVPLEGTSAIGALAYANGSPNPFVAPVQNIPGMPGYGQTGESEATTQLKEGITDVTNSWVHSIGEVVTATTTLKTAIVDMGKSILNEMLSIAEQAAAKKLVGGIFSLLGLAGGGYVSYAAGGIDAGYSGSVRNVVVGERGPELMQVGRSGVRVFSNSETNRMMNDVSSSGRGGGADLSFIASAINNLAERITPASAEEVNYAIIKANNIRNGRI